VEPDALPDLIRGCLSGALAAQRYQLLQYAMRRLGGLPHTDVYLDAGNPGMFADPARLAAPLIKAGIRFGRGFSANVSNFLWTSAVVAWSQRLEASLGGQAGAVIDTSRNGNGPYTGPDTPQWCNPPGRAPGPAQRISPGPAGIDAYLWIKDPGVSDGACNGGPAAGQFWAAYAEGLAAGAASRPAGTS
jgi:endoglucanase